MASRGVGKWIAACGPGLLVAATGVGAGDLATAGFSASKLGFAVLWAVVVGAAVKFAMTEGLARWQLGTGQTLIEGVRHRIGRWPLVLFLIYLIAWCYFVSVALATATGVATHALAPLEFELPFFQDSDDAARYVFGAIASLAGFALAWFGGFRVFERVMGVCVAVMFAAVVVAAVVSRPDWGGVGRGLVVPTVPEGGLAWTIALMGGVGGTVTILAYGYWIREAGREDPSDLAGMRIDLGIGYAATALFGIAVAILAANASLDGSGVRLVVELADRLGATLGTSLRLLFLVGVWAAVVSSLLGVWQVAPSIVVDTLDQIRPPKKPGKTRYRVALTLIAMAPLVGHTMPFRQAQLVYALAGAAFIPMLALVVLFLTSRASWIGSRRMASGPIAIAMLTLTLLASIVFGVESGCRAARKLTPPPAAKAPDEVALHNARPRPVRPGDPDGRGLRRERTDL